MSSFQLGLYERSGREPQGLAYDGEYLWLMDACNMTLGDIQPNPLNIPYIYRLTTNGSIVSSFPPPNFDELEPFPPKYNPNTKDLAWDGSRLRLAVSGSDEGRIYKINPASPNPDDWIKLQHTQVPFGVGWGGGNIWTVDNKTGTVYRVNPNTGSTISSFETSAEMGTPRKPGGLAYETGADRIWLTGFGKYDKIYGYTTTGSFVKSFDTSPATHPIGLTWDGTYLWLVDGCSDYFYKIQ